MEHAKYLGITVDESGKEARMYASKGVVIHFAIDTNVVITVYKEKTTPVQSPSAYLSTLMRS